MTLHWYFGLVVIFAVWAIATVYVAQSRRRSSQNQKRAWVSFVLLWPLVLGADKSTRAGRLLTAREWLGWAIVGLLITLGVFVSSH
jgi:hypothetical protein